MLKNDLMIELGQLPMIKIGFCRSEWKQMFGRSPTITVAVRRHVHFHLVG